jgi:phosphoglycerol transferase MdoB-like AlkP superfamily enzyme
VDYLIYTYEVVTNIHQSYPLPLIGLVLAVVIIGTFLLFRSVRVFKYTFSDRPTVWGRARVVFPILGSCFLLFFFLRNKMAEFGNNHTLNELGKNGSFSFVSAFRANELDYATFYPTMSESKAYSVLRKELLQRNQVFESNEGKDIRRLTLGDSTLRPNIVLITIESFSASFSGLFGNREGLTPNFDRLAGEGVFFSNLYATGTRTVRGMEALTLCVPPTPGNSIVRRLDNDHLYSIATVLRSKDYHPYFIYGGDGYFDNMNHFFAGQGFDIVDRDRGNPLPEAVTTHRYSIPDSAVEFENAWGICDEDLYKQSIQYADQAAQAKKPFFQFIMTTSNHKPYTFPKGRIAMPQGDRNAAVRYTDYALGKFIEAARKKSWFEHTVFVIVADHCASSAGKWEINIDKHHIPAIILNLGQREKVNRLISQIDLMPTLFGYLHWNYSSSFYGRDIRQTDSSADRALIGNYRTLGLLKGEVFTQVDDRKRVKQFAVSSDRTEMKVLKNQQPALIWETIAFYQTASERYASGLMKEKPGISSE